MTDVLAEVYVLNYTKADLKNVLIDLLQPITTEDEVNHDVKSTPHSTVFSIYLCTVLVFGIPGKCSKTKFC